eukprot:CAMPEP_0184496586 /NCGR_PEP_ID=MMETSP0113_2-20130426/34327_1 /TAXON_ID=91329 /ORGANISM="Norrisiella sphaerica, Strain BC52" /LENGTH=589 /DNA_ID=CAMNT_0026883267 /DNA_START=435 /DNA_END=2203 /DNA_ORIENTATION=+
MRSGRRPPAVVCYLCGQQYGTSSIKIHIPQCQQLFLKRERLKLRREQRPLPLPPPGYMENIEQGVNSGNMNDFNDLAFNSYNSNLSACPNCHRTFTDSALQVHLRSCKNLSSSSRPQSVSPAAPLRSPKFRICYICGRKYGTTSLKIHLPQCEKIWKQRELRKAPADRKPVPQPPEGWSMEQKEPDQWDKLERLNQMASDSHNSFGLSPCPHCARTFNEDSLKIHLRSCRPGNVTPNPRKCLNEANLGKHIDGNRSMNSGIGSLSAPTPLMISPRSPKYSPRISPKYSSKRSTQRNLSSTTTTPITPKLQEASASYGSYSDSRPTQTVELHQLLNRKDLEIRKLRQKVQQLQTQLASLSRMNKHKNSQHFSLAWTTGEVKDWVTKAKSKFGLKEDTVEALVKQDIDGLALRSLIDCSESMKALGIKYGQASRVSRAIDNLYEASSNNGDSQIVPRRSEGQSGGVDGKYIESALRDLDVTSKTEESMTNNTTQLSMHSSEEYEEPLTLEACPDCGRKFKPETLKKHIALKLCRKKRRVFNASKSRMHDDTMPPRPPSELRHGSGVTTGKYKTNAEVEGGPGSVQECNETK